MKYGKGKIDDCSLKLSSLESVPLPITDQLRSSFYKLHRTETEVYKTRLKKYHVQCR